ncbi:hypothetical protein HWV62_21022 [Athelia sp. TMB]|nr:hypothetical protein HWV62_21022 [Athelia sp. TMB]
MEDSDGDSEGTVGSLTVASMLGIRGSLRFRAHGSSQKAHVILRRVEVTDDSTDDEKSNTVVYFSLFAQKRIEVKPGKEILLCLPATNGHFGDQAVVFEGDLPGPGESAEDTGYSAMDVGKEHVVPPIRDILPPKMRRTWTKRVPDSNSAEEGCPIIPLDSELSTMASIPPPTYSSIAVQVEPGVIPPETPPCVQTYTSIPIQTQEITRDITSTHVQTDIVDILPEHKTSVMEGAGLNFSNEWQIARVRSLSPIDMELDSQCSTPRSPTHKASVAAAYILPSTASSIASSLPASPPDLTSPLVRSPTYTPSVPILELPCDREVPEFSMKDDTSIIPDLHILSHPTPSVTSPPEVHGLPAPKPHGWPPRPATDPTILPQHISLPNGVKQPPNGPRALSGMNGVALQARPLPNGTSGSNVPAAEQLMASTPFIPAKRKQAIPNPFISAGFMTEFVGVATPKSEFDNPKASQSLPTITKNIIHPPAHLLSMLTPPASSPKPSMVVAATEPTSSPPLPPTKPALMIDIPSRASTASAMEESPISPVIKDEVISPSIPEMLLPSKTDNIFIKEESLSPMQESPLSPSEPNRAGLKSGLVSAQSRNGASRSPHPTTSLNSPIGAFMEKPHVAIPSMGRFPTASHEIVHGDSASTAVPNANAAKSIFAVSKGTTSSAPPKPTYIDVDAYVPKHLPPKPSYLPARPAVSRLQATGSSSTGRRPIYIDVDAVPIGHGQGKYGYPAECLRKSPPPDPRSLAGISIGPSSNPLGIRPSSGYRIPSQTKVAPNTAANGQKKSRKKKPVKVGSGWPYAPTAGGANATPLGPARTHGSVNMSRKRRIDPDQPPQGDLGSILLYPSRSPSPVTVPTLHSQTHTRKGGAGLRASETRPNDHGHVTAIKAEPVDDVIPFQSPILLDKTGYPLVFDFSEPVPLPPAKKARGQVERPGQNQMKASKTNGKFHMHLLPSKPDAAVPQANSRESRGIKRTISPLSREPYAVRTTVQRTIRWPTIESTHRLRIKGDKDVAIKELSFSSDGSQFLVNCDDKTVRIWNNRSRTEMAKLAYNSPVISVSWMIGDTGIVSLCEDGIVSKWSRTSSNQWQWAKIVDAGTDCRDDDGKVCLAYMRDRVAVALPKYGVKVWLWIKGTWQPQRSILRQNVTSIKFVEDGDALLGGTKDGVLWYCGVPNGTIRAMAFLRSEVRTLDVDPTGNIALAAQAGGRAHLVSVGPSGDGKIQQVYAIKDEELVQKLTHEFGAVFANQGQTVLFGSMNGCVLVWDKEKANVLCVLDHCEGKQ